MSENSNTPSTTPSNSGKTVQKKKSFRNRHRKSSNNLKVKPLEQLDNEVGKQNGKVNSEKIPKNQVNKENNDNKKPEIEKKEVDKKKNKYHKKKSMSDLKKAETKSETLSDTKSDVTSSTNEKPDLKKSASKQFLSQKKKRKSKMNLKAEKQEEEKEEDNSDIKLIESFLTSLSMKRDEMEREEEELNNNPPPPQHTTTNKYTKRQSFSGGYANKAYKPKKELPVYDDEEIKRVLDCYNFPVEYKTHNLMDMFKEYEGNFRINWINDTRALFIFNTEENARSALLSKQNETKYKIEPYENPTSEFSPLNDESESESISQNINESESENEIESKSENEKESENEDKIKNEYVNKKVYEQNQPNETRENFAKHDINDDYSQKYSKYEKREYSSNYSKYEKREYPSNHSKYDKREYQPRQNEYNQSNQSRQQVLRQKSSSSLRQTSQESQEKPVRRQRPVTSDVVARRLISSALGIKPREKTEEEKEIDRKKFEEARAQRQAARLERQKRLQENNDIFNE